MNNNSHSQINCSSLAEDSNNVTWMCWRYNSTIEHLLIVLFTLLIFGTLGGNCLVISAIILVKKLQIPSNFLILSLAASDTLVAFFLPLVAFIQLRGGHWPFSETFCDIFICLDVLLCSSSILNLCAISIDRYLIITKPLQYGSRRTLKQMFLMILLVWFLSGLISIPPVIGWKEGFIPGKCIYSENLGYQIYATCGAFYIPLIIMLVLYGRIFKLTQSMVKKDAKLHKRASRYASDVLKMPDLNDDSVVKENICKRLSLSDQSSNDWMDSKKLAISNAKEEFIKQYKKTEKANYAENKAITTLGVIMGCFTICWLPFFVIQLIKPLLKVANIDSNLYISQWIQDMFLWLGYLNSFLNPIIYAKFNREFRTPFKLILLCKCVGINAVIRSEAYTQQYGSRIPPCSSKRNKYVQNTIQKQTEVKYKNCNNKRNTLIEKV
uniref:GCR039 n=1 Tax=Schmidtea mediterranea TaxID=79327 RepID=A0A193KU83_SCHMD|nr:GCR039 [Schmidtea mediterranea]